MKCLGGGGVLYGDWLGELSPKSNLNSTSGPRIGHMFNWSKESDTAATSGMITCSPRPSKSSSSY